MEIVGDSSPPVVDMTSGEACVSCSERNGENVKILSCGHWTHLSCLRTRLENFLTALDSGFFTLPRCPSDAHCALGWSDVAMAKEMGEKSMRKLANVIMNNVESGIPHEEVTARVNDIAGRLVQLIALYSKPDTPTKRRKTKKKARRAGFPNNNGVGFGGSAQSDAKLAKTSVIKANTRNHATDQLLVAALKDIRRSLSRVAFLSTHHAPRASSQRTQCDDALVVGYLFLIKAKAGASALDVLLSLWRNDSLMDITTRLTLYKECLLLIEEMLAYQETAFVLFAKCDSDEADASSTAQSKKRRRQSDELSKVLTAQDSADTLFSLLLKVCAQGKIFLRRGANLESDGLEVFVTDLKSVSDRLEKYGTKSKLANGVQKKTRRAIQKRRHMLLKAKNLSKEDREKAYTVALQELSFKAVAMSDMIRANMLSHLFHNTALQCTQALGSNRKRITRISRELSTLSTSLPANWGSSIFVRADQDRPDLLVALILGPEGTPYQNGAFVFDIWLPGGYPSVPPKVLLTTTGNGQVRFNPNLYACGKVCLSLLGTWSGPGWTSTSTLLQVLISIQSLIMVDEPYYNEPGFENSRKSAYGMRASMQYNARIRSATLQHAVLGALAKPHRLFEDVLKAHFTLKREEIMQQCTSWNTSQQMKDRIGAYLRKLSSDSNSSSSSSSAPVESINLVYDEPAKVPPRPSNAEVICLDDDDDEDPVSAPNVSEMKQATELVDLT